MNLQAFNLDNLCVTLFIKSGLITLPPTPKFLFFLYWLELDCPFLTRQPYFIHFFIVWFQPPWSWYSRPHFYLNISLFWPLPLVLVPLPPFYFNQMFQWLVHGYSPRCQPAKNLSFFLSLVVSFMTPSSHSITSVTLTLKVWASSLRITQFQNPPKNDEVMKQSREKTVCFTFGLIVKPWPFGCRPGSYAWLIISWLLTFLPYDFKTKKEQTRFVTTIHSSRQKAQHQKSPQNKMGEISSKLRNIKLYGLKLNRLSFLSLILDTDYLFNFTL